MKIRLTPEDFVRLSPGTACFLRGTFVLPAKISLILLPEWSEMFPPEPFPDAIFSYPQITARDFSIKLQPIY
ncbi:hypothetical protein GEY59_21615 [Salmonella enterica subsp. enterica serovar Mikawasima]|uniref:Uncharacterized protein n=2 Tax=Salmonella enterica I TaxID=59201 RepID=A0A5I0RNG1_SALET|nr:hypothetical protein [Salmonella enterica subsp. enterica serovar Mikawasima]EAA1856104.1 hypothetical protein [Salmonella enterica subsp. enterica serovar Chester]EAB8697718.1 hypothetical protein [Salmonella enterica]EBS2176310.1 hypothetical protein [Salmonella enterica subsp. enterica serovar Telelkebir]EBS4798725.1 hypothetical protein [Salmonella enterica subsp. enterica serovar Newport]EBX1258974.1 hypothetical protein [Salmonella enterica subsp. enterica serovar Montevideo]EBY46218